jgi:hypothetical protein
MRKKRKSSAKKSKAATRKHAKKTSRRGRAKNPKKPVGKKQLEKKISPKGNPTRKKKAPARRSQQFESSKARAAANAFDQTGDLQGLSRAEQADSESVDELVEEGNIFEAGAVAGVEEADDHDTREVHTQEVSEDDVPDEYLEKD